MFSKSCDAYVSVVRLKRIAFFLQKDQIYCTMHHSKDSAELLLSLQANSEKKKFDICYQLVEHINVDYLAF